MNAALYRLNQPQKRAQVAPMQPEGLKMKARLFFVAMLIAVFVSAYVAGNLIRFLAGAV